MPSSLSFASALMTETSSFAGTGPADRGREGARAGQRGGRARDRRGSRPGRRGPTPGLALERPVRPRPHEEERRAVVIGPPHDGVDVDHATLGRAEPETDGAADDERLVEPDLCADRAQVERLAIERSAAALDGHWPGHARARVPSKIGGVDVHRHLPSPPPPRPAKGLPDTMASSLLRVKD